MSNIKFVEITKTLKYYIIKSTYLFFSHRYSNINVTCLQSKPYAVDTNKQALDKNLMSCPDHAQYISNEIQPNQVY